VPDHEQSCPNFGAGGVGNGQKCSGWKAMTPRSNRLTMLRWPAPRNGLRDCIAVGWRGGLGRTRLKAEGRRLSRPMRLNLPQNPSYRCKTFQRDASIARNIGAPAATGARRFAECAAGRAGLREAQKPAQGRPVLRTWPKPDWLRPRLKGKSRCRKTSGRCPTSSLAHGDKCTVIMAGCCPLQP